MKSKFKRHDDKYMFRAHYLCKHCSGDSIADRYLAAKAHRKAMDLHREMWNEMKKHLEKQAHKHAL